MSGEGISLNIEEVLHSTIKKYGMLKEGDGIVVGVSGGPDSIALFHLLYRFKEYYGIKLVVAHLNHNFRPGDAEREAEYVEKFCECRNIPCIVEFCDVPSMARRESLSAEQAGRKARYSFFNKVMKHKNYNKIAVAHNQNDQVETVLMRFIRGSGMEGLGGIHPVRDNIIRPLLEISRPMIDEYCKEYNLNPALDKSNLEPVYTRNRIRLELLPYLKKEYNKNIDRTICNTAYILREENCFLNEVALEKFNQLFITDDKNKLVLDLNGLNSLNDIFLRRVLRLAVERLKGDKNNLEYGHIQNLCRLVKSGRTGSRVHLPEGLTAKLSYGKFFLCGEDDKIMSIDNVYHIEIPGITPIDELGGILEAEILTKDDYKGNGNKRKKYAACFDLNKTGKDLFLRKRKEGDKFKPLGMKGTKKLKDFFIDLKIPREERDTIPIIHNCEAIIWIMGYRICDEFKIDANTRTILKLSFKHVDEEE